MIRITAVNRATWRSSQLGLVQEAVVIHASIDSAAWSIWSYIRREFCRVEVKMRWSLHMILMVIGELVCLEIGYNENVGLRYSWSLRAVYKCGACAFLNKDIQWNSDKCWWTRNSMLMIGSLANAVSLSRYKFKAYGRKGQSIYLSWQCRPRCFLWVNPSITDGNLDFESEEDSAWSNTQNPRTIINYVMSKQIRSQFRKFVIA